MRENLCVRLRLALLFALSLTFLPSCYADPMYTFTTDIGPISASPVWTDHGTYRELVDTFTVVNNGSSTLTGVYFVATDPIVNGTDLNLTSPGVYVDPSYTVTFVNQTGYILGTQTNASLNSYSTGSTVTPQIPVYLVASSLCASCQTQFTVTLQESPDTVPTLQYFNGFFAVQSGGTPPAVTPEPSASLLTATGMLALLAVPRSRRRFADQTSA